MSAFAAGAVWKKEMYFSDDFRFRRKYCVLLNTCADASGHLVVAFTTSKGERYRGETSSQCGCPAASCYRVEAGQVPCFPVKTWIQFNNIVPECTPGDLKACEAAGSAKYLQDLPPNLLFSVLHCASRSVDLTGKQLGLIDGTLRILKAQREQAAKAKQPPAPPAKAATTIDSVRAELGRCGKCEADFCGLLGIPLEEFDSHLAGPVDAKLAGDIKAALDLLKEQSGGNEIGGSPR